jgi:amino acid transporter
MTAIKIITVVKLLPLILLVAVGLFNMKGGNMVMANFPSIEKLGAASLILFFAFTGGETALNISGEMKNPGRTGPLGLLIGVVGLFCFTVLSNWLPRGYWVLI